MTDALESFKEKTSLEWNRKPENKNWWPWRSISYVAIGLLRLPRTETLCLQVETHKPHKYDLVRYVGRKFSGEERIDRKAGSEKVLSFLWCDITPVEFSEKAMEIARFLQGYKESVDSS